MEVSRAPELYELISRTEFKWADGLIHLFIGGSAAHGARLGGGGDLDLYGVYIPPIDKVAGITEYEMVEGSDQPKAIDPEKYVFQTAKKGERNNSDDIDVNFYSLRKWAGMAASGNPTAMEFLFTHNFANRAPVWEEHIRPNTAAFLSSHAGLHFQGFCEHMLRTLKGEGTGKRGQRDDLIGEFGYDTKAAMHLLRVLGEGIELMENGKITLPRPEKDFLIGVRIGQAGTLADIEKMAKERLAMLESARLKSPLPEAVDRKRITEIITAAQVDVWDHNATSAMKVIAKALNIAVFWIAESCKLHPVGERKEWEDKDIVRRDILGLAIEFHKQDEANAAKK